LVVQQWDPLPVWVNIIYCIIGQVLLPAAIPVIDKDLAYPVFFPYENDPDPVA
jgi:hypothetical protein